MCQVTLVCCRCGNSWELTAECRCCVAWKAVLHIEMKTPVTFRRLGNPDLATGVQPILGTDFPSPGGLYCLQTLPTCPGLLRSWEAPSPLHAVTKWSASSCIVDLQNWPPSLPLPPELPFFGDSQSLTVCLSQMRRGTFIDLYWAFNMNS